MAKYNVYVRKSLEPTLFQEAARRGVEPAVALRKKVNDLLESIGDGSKSETILAKLTALEAKVEAISLLLEIATAEVGFLSGMTRASTKDKENLTRAGTTLEGHMRQVAARLRREAKIPLPNHLVDGKADS